MKVKVAGVLRDAEKEPVFLVFANTEELKTHIKNLQQMVDRPPPAGHASVYAVYPDGSMTRDEAWEEYNRIQVEIGEKPITLSNSEPPRKRLSTPVIEVTSTRKPAGMGVKTAKNSPPRVRKPAKKATRKAPVKKSRNR